MRGRAHASIEELRDRNVLVLASTGGHLTQAVTWAGLLNFSEDSVFVSFESDQATSLLGERLHVWVPYVKPRGVAALLVAAFKVGRIPLSGQSAIVSTGAGLALAGLLKAYLTRLPFYYIESVSRFSGPSLTGKLLELMPRVNLLAQHPNYRNKRWARVEPLLSSFRIVNESVAPHARGRRIFVTLGTIRPYRFDRLVDLVLAQLLPTDEVAWQLGVTSRSQLPGRVLDHMAADDFAAAVRWSDVVVTHGGVGTLLTLLDMGKMPVVLDRERKRAEHVDNHQNEVVSRLVQLGLAVRLDSDDSLQSVVCKRVEGGF